jgi:hypothetical protein
MITDPEEIQLEHSSETLYCHGYWRCKGGPCSVHDRTEHNMRAFPQHWRDDKGIMERICEHGVGHPDPDDIKVRMGRDEACVHGCDGCCASATET